MPSQPKISERQGDTQLYLKKILFEAVKAVSSLDIFLVAKLIDI